MLSRITGIKRLHQIYRTFSTESAQNATTDQLKVLPVKALPINEYVDSKFQFYLAKQNRWDIPSLNIHSGTSSIAALCVLDDLMTIKSSDIIDDLYILNFVTSHILLFNNNNNLIPQRIKVEPNKFKHNLFSKFKSNNNSRILRLYPDGENLNSILKIDYTKIENQKVEMRDSEEIKLNKYAYSSLKEMLFPEYLLPMSEDMTNNTLSSEQFHFLFSKIKRIYDTYIANDSIFFTDEHILTMTISNISNFLSNSTSLQSPEELDWTYHILYKQLFSLLPKNFEKADELEIDSILNILNSVYKICQNSTYSFYTFNKFGKMISTPLLKSIANKLTNSNDIYNSLYMTNTQLFTRDIPSIFQYYLKYELEGEEFFENLLLPEICRNTHILPMSTISTILESLTIDSIFLQEGHSSLANLLSLLRQFKIRVLSDFQRSDNWDIPLLSAGACLSRLNLLTSHNLFICSSATRQGLAAYKFLPNKDGFLAWMRISMDTELPAWVIREIMNNIIFPPYFQLTSISERLIVCHFIISKSLLSTDFENEVYNKRGISNVYDTHIWSRNEEEKFTRRTVNYLHDFLDETFYVIMKEYEESIDKINDDNILDFLTYYMCLNSPEQIDEVNSSICENSEILNYFTKYFNTKDNNIQLFLNRENVSEDDWIINAKFGYSNFHFVDLKNSIFIDIDDGKGLLNKSVKREMVSKFLKGKYRVINLINYSVLHLKDQGVNDVIFDQQSMDILGPENWSVNWVNEDDDSCQTPEDYINYLKTEDMANPDELTLNTFNTFFNDEGIAHVEEEYAAPTRHSINKRFPTG